MFLSIPSLLEHTQPISPALFSSSLMAIWSSQVTKLIKLVSSYTFVFLLSLYWDIIWLLLFCQCCLHMFLSIHFNCHNLSSYLTSKVLLYKRFFTSFPTFRISHSSPSRTCSLEQTARLFTFPPSVVPSCWNVIYPSGTRQ